MGSAVVIYSAKMALCAILNHDVDQAGGQGDARHSSTNTPVYSQLPCIISIFYDAEVYVPLCKSANESTI